MDDKWEGFTVEEILNIANQKTPYNKDAMSASSPVKKLTIVKQNKLGKKNMTRERMLKTNQKTAEKEILQSEEAKLNIPQVLEKDELPDKIVLDPVTSTDLHPTSPGDLKATDSPSPNDIKTSSELKKKSGCPLPLFNDASETNLKEFDKRQKMMEEQNRQRKALLKKALEDRTKRTHEEARRLSQIEEELKKLDVQLSSDVSILRNQIEVASLEYMDAQKRFDRAEREYLDAKLALFTKQERKELLTGHLCTIIEQNELRKAKKLSDLMDKLQLNSVIIEKPMEVLVENKEEITHLKDKNDEQKEDIAPPT